MSLTLSVSILDLWLCREPALDLFGEVGGAGERSGRAAMLAPLLAHVPALSSYIRIKSCRRLYIGRVGSATYNLYSEG